MPRAGSGTRMTRDRRVERPGRRSSDALRADLGVRARGSSFRSVWPYRYRFRRRIDRNPIARSSRRCRFARTADPGLFLPSGDRFPRLRTACRCRDCRTAYRDPDQPQMTSSPSNPAIVSFPARPWMTSSPGVPKIVLLLLSPTTVAGSPLHRTGGCTVVAKGEVSTFKLPPQLKGWSTLQPLTWPSA